MGGNPEEEGGELGEGGWDLMGFDKMVSKYENPELPVYNHQRSAPVK